MSQLNPLVCSTGEDEQFVLKLINRPILVLRGENGFVCHHKNSNTLDASRSVYDIFSLLFSDGAYHIKSESYCVSRDWWKFHWATQTLLGEFPDTCNFFFSHRWKWKVLVCLRQWSGVHRWGETWGFLLWVCGVWTGWNQVSEWQVPAWRPGRDADGWRVQRGRLFPVGALSAATNHRDTKTDSLRNNEFLYWHLLN